MKCSKCGKDVDQVFGRDKKCGPCLATHNKGKTEADHSYDWTGETRRIRRNRGWDK